MTDWTTCLVVRDRDGELWVWGAIRARWMRLELYAEATADQLADFGPLVPVLDADGLPVVRAVGDLTARHIGRRVRVDGIEWKLEALLAYGYDGTVVLELLTDDDRGNNIRCTPDTPCEALP